MNKSFFPKMAVSNIKKNSKLYIPYIITEVLTVMMFFMNIVLVTNKNVAAMKGGSSVVMLLQVALVVSFIFSGVFLFYTNSFLMKRRKKEIGLYNILGMEKKHISYIMFYENLYIAFIALSAGIVTGIVFGRLMFLVLMKLIKADNIPKFLISGNAVTVTIVFFACIFIATFVYNFTKVQMSKPIELLHSDEIGEKEPKTKLIMTILGIVCLGGGYYFALTVENVLKAASFFFIAAFFVVIGTYLLFTAGSIAFIKLLKKNKKFYYKTGHFTGISGMLYRMKQNAVGLANICVLSTVVLVAVATTVSLYAGMKDSLDTAYPYEQNIVVKAVQDDSFDKVREKIQEYVDRYGADIKKSLEYKDMALIGRIDEQNTFVTAGAGTYLSGDENASMCMVVEVSDFNNMTGKEYSIDSSDSVILVTKEEIDGNKEFTINKNEEYLNYNVSEVIKDSEYLSGEIVSIMKSYILVVKDMNEVNKIRNTIYGDSNVRSGIDYNIFFDTDLSVEDSKKLSHDIEYMAVSEDDEDCYIMCNNRYDISEELTQMYGGLLFLGCYVGALLIIATVLIIYYKQISEGYEDRRRFEIMMKVGMSHEEVRKTIKTQILMVFFIPIVVAVIHVAVAFRIIKKLLLILSLGSSTSLFIWCTILTVLMFCIVYVLVFVITARSYYNIVNGK